MRMFSTLFAVIRLLHILTILSLQIMMFFPGKIYQLQQFLQASCHAYLSIHISLTYGQVNYLPFSSIMKVCKRIKNMAVGKGAFSPIYYCSYLS